MNKTTNGRYKLVFVDENTNQIYPIFCDPKTGTFLRSGKQPERGLDLTTLDIYLMTHILDEKHLRSILKQLDYQIESHWTPQIAYRHANRTKYLELVYQRKDVYDMALLFSQYKKKYAFFTIQHQHSSPELRKKILDQLKKELIWKQFYMEMIHWIHQEKFYAFLEKTGILGTKVMDDIKKYLEWENYTTPEQERTFLSAEYHLKETFTAYKLVREFLINKLQYCKNLDIVDLKQNIEIELLPIERSKQMEIFQDQTTISCKGYSKKTWYEQTSRILTPEEIAYLEEQDAFDQLRETSKIELVNRIIAREKVYQKK